MKHKSHKHPVVNGSHLSEGLRLTLKQPERLTPHVMLKKVTWEKHSIIQFHQSFVNQDFVRGFNADGFTRDVRMEPLPAHLPHHQSRYMLCPAAASVHAGQTGLTLPWSRVRCSHGRAQLFLMPVQTAFLGGSLGTMAASMVRGHSIDMC